MTNKTATAAKPSLNDRLLASGRYIPHPSGNGVVLLKEFGGYAERPQPKAKAWNCDEAGFPLHAGNPVWMD